MNFKVKTGFFQILVTIQKSFFRDMRHCWKTPIWVSLLLCVIFASFGMWGLRSPSVIVDSETDATEYAKCKVLLVEVYRFHREIISSWIYFANSLGIVPYLDLAESAFDGFYTTLNQTGLQFRREKYRAREFDVIVRNSFYLPSDDPWSAAMPKGVDPNWPPRTLEGGIVSIIHTQGRMDEIDQHQRIMTLCPHVQPLGVKNQSLTAIPALPSQNVADSDVARRFTNRAFVVQGTLEKRNFKSILTIVRKFCGKVPDFKIVLLGKYYEPSNLKDEKCIEVQSNVDFTKYQQTLRDSFFLLPLIDDSFEHRYFTKKCSSSIPLALMFQIPLIVFKPFADLYEHLLQGQLEYNNETMLLEKVEHALNLDLASYRKMVEGVKVSLVNAEQIGRNSFQAWLGDSCKNSLRQSVDGKQI